MGCVRNCVRTCLLQHVITEHAKLPARSTFTNTCKRQDMLKRKRELARVHEKAGAGVGQYANPQPTTQPATPQRYDFLPTQKHLRKHGALIS